MKDLIIKESRPTEPETVMTTLYEVIRESEKTEQRICDVIEKVVRQGEDLDKQQKEKIVQQYLDSSTAKSAMKYDVMRIGLVVLGIVAVAGLVAFGLSSSSDDSS